MALSVWQRHIVDEAGNVQAAASVGVKLADTATNASIYEDQDGLAPLANPFAADVTGFAQFYIDNGEYDIYVGGVKKWSHVQRYRLDAIIAAETGAESARDKAEEWAEKAEDVEVEVGQYSALHHAAKASTSATSASGSATAAQGAKTAAEAAQVAAELAEDNAVAVVYSGEASLTPAAGKIPIADANGHIDPTWIGSITTVNPSLDLNFGQQEYRSYVDHLGLTSWPLVGTGTKITFTRAGTGGGTYFDAMGVMQQAGENEPRIDYDPATGECLGLLVEESRANLLLNSLLNATALSTQDVTVTAVAHTLSFYGTGTVTLSGTHAATVVGLGAAPTRTTLTFTPTVGTLTVTVSGTVQWANLGIGAFATSFIPTAASAVTRSADVCSITSTNFSEWYRQGVGTVVCEGDAVFATLSVQIWEFDGGSSANRIVIDIGTSNNYLRFRTVKASSSTQVLRTNNVSSSGELHKIAATWSTVSGEGAASIDGSTAEGSNTSDIPTNITRLWLGQYSSAGAAINGHIRKLQYWTQRLSNATLQALTRG